jgi:hypothetical protein
MEEKEKKKETNKINNVPKLGWPIVSFHHGKKTGC